MRLKVAKLSRIKDLVGSQHTGELGGATRPQWPIARQADGPGPHSCRPHAILDGMTDCGSKPRVWNMLEEYGS
jgi:hypothetical protein